MICPNCGQEIPDGIKFCPKCGTNLILSKESPSGAEETPVKIVPLEKLPPATTRSATLPSDTQDPAKVEQNQELNASSIDSTKAAPEKAVSSTSGNNVPKYIYYSKDTDLIIPAAFRPMSVLSTGGYLLLFMVPIVGWITAVVFSFDSTNLHRRNLARGFVIATVLFTLLTVIVYAVAPGLPLPRVILR